MISKDNNILCALAYGLESYMINEDIEIAEEGFVNKVTDNLPQIILGAFAAAGVISITTAGVISIIERYKLNRTYAPFAPAKAIYMIVNSAKYESIQVNSNIYDLLKTGESVIQGSVKYFDALNKAIVDKSEKDAVIAIDNLTKYFDNAVEQKFKNISAGETLTLYRGSADIRSLQSALREYTDRCDQIFTKNSAVYDAFTSRRVVVDTNKVTTVDSSGTRSVSYQHSPKVEALPPSRVTVSALTEYKESLTRFHKKIIDIKIKRK